MTQKSYVVLFMRGPARTGRPLTKIVLDKWRKEDWELFKETYKEETYTEDDETEFERAMEICESIAKQKEE